MYMYYRRQRTSAAWLPTTWYCANSAWRTHRLRQVDQHLHALVGAHVRHVLEVHGRWDEPRPPLALTVNTHNTVTAIRRRHTRTICQITCRSAARCTYMHTGANFDNEQSCSRLYPKRLSFALCVLVKCDVVRKICSWTSLRAPQTPLIFQHLGKPKINTEADTETELKRTKTLIHLVLKKQVYL